ncbi:MAG: hypothetical protein HYX26_08455 [Acidobacteriales bacterium]|nr:hypothetical protein [Terriglobales bacterium]
MKEEIGYFRESIVPPLVGYMAARVALVAGEIVLRVPRPVMAFLAVLIGALVFWLAIPRVRLRPPFVIWHGIFLGVAIAAYFGAKYFGM